MRNLYYHLFCISIDIVFILDFCERINDPPIIPNMKPIMNYELVHVCVLGIL